MNSVDKDDFSHALGQTLQFYGKELDQTQFSFWYRALADRPIHKIKEALLEYVKVGKYAPRPANIIELIGSSTEQHRAALPSPETVSKPCPPDIHKAWNWFISMYTKGSNLEGVIRSGEVSAADQERYLHLVNHEAKRVDMIEAIPEEFRLKEVWG